jgi:hypothetical protein
MSLTRWLVLAAAVLVLGIVSLSSGPVAQADTVDPAIGVRGCTGACSVLWDDVNGITFTINSDNATGCDTTAGCQFTSGGFFSDVNITNFDFSFGADQPGGFSPTADSAFQSLQPVSGSEAILSGGTIFPPCIECIALFDVISSTNITGDFQFEINGVTDGTTVHILSNVAPVPEPGTIILLGSGLGAVALRKLRLRKARSTAA